MLSVEETRKILVDSIKDQIRTLQEFENDVAKASLTGVPKNSTLLSKKYVDLHKFEEGLDISEISSTLSHINSVLRSWNAPVSFNFDAQQNKVTTYYNDTNWYL